MEYILDELKQFVIKEITETEILENQPYPKLLKHKKYLIVHYKEENPEKIKLIGYAGRLCDITPYYPGAYGDLGEGISFFGIYRENRIVKSSSYTLYTIIKGISFPKNYDTNFSLKFYELEDNFCKQNILDSFSHVTINNDLNNIPNIIQMHLTKISISIWKTGEIEQNDLDLIFDSDNINSDSDDNYE
jgi:hypothetical protein